MDRYRAPIALAPEDGEALWCVGALSRFKATAAQTEGAYSLVEDLAPQGSGTPLHRHDDDDEAFYVLEGEITFFLADTAPIHGRAGSFVHIPGGTIHGFRVESETARYLIITTPQHERFYRALGEPAQSLTLPPELPMDMEKIGAVCAAHGVEFAGPRPDDGCSTAVA